MSSASSRFLGENLRALSRTRVLSKPTLVPVPSAVNSFPLLFSPRRPGEEAPRGLPLDSRTPRTWSRGELRPQCGGARRYPGRGGGRSAWGVRFTCTLGTSFSPQGAWPWLRLDGPRPREPGRGWGRLGGSSQGQVPQGHTRPGGCKPQAKVERGWSFSSNPFYTVKTAKLSPRRPLFNWEANRRKTKTNAQADFLSLCFLNKKPAVWRRGKQMTSSHVCLLRGLDWGALEAAWTEPLSPCSPPSISPRGSPTESLLSTGNALPCKPRRALSLWC